MANALIVDDDGDFCRMMAALVARHGFAAATAQSLQLARHQIKENPPDVVLLDLELPDGSGMSLFDEPALLANSEVVLMTGVASLESSVQALRYGAADYLIKPVSARQLGSILSRVARPAVLQARLTRLQEEFQRSGAFGSLVGRSGAMQLVYDLIGRVAQSSVPVLISGESGTGKELAARTIHRLSRREAGPFVAVNCGAIGMETLDAELFGHDAGASPDGSVAGGGLLERAHGGTLFLDEIHDMPRAMQAKLVRVLETGRYSPVGSVTSRVIDVRLISATTRNPAQAEQARTLRQDLFYRLNVFPIEMPPLRERMEDLPLLVAHLLREIGRAEGAFKTMGSVALQRLAQYPWPGNVRELRNALHQSHVMTPEREIRHPWLPRDAGAPRANGARAGGISGVGGGKTLAQVEREVVLATLEEFGHHRERTAAALGISIKTLYNRLKEYGL